MTVIYTIWGTPTAYHGWNRYFFKYKYQSRSEVRCLDWGRALGIL